MAEPISPRVANGLGAAGSSAPLTVIFIYYLNKYSPLPPEIAAAYASIFTAGCGFLGGWLTRLEPKLLPAAPPGPAVIIPPGAGPGP